MFDLSERLSLGCRSRLTAAAVAVTAAACLAVTGCSAVSSIASSAASAQAPHLVSTGGASPAVALGAGMSGFASPASSVVPPDPLGPPADPFTGTPADHWADGAAGIVLPAAAPIGGFTTAQVKLAYQWTRKLLIAGFLDKSTLLGGAPAAFAKLLTSQQRTWFLDNLNDKGVDKSGVPLSSRAWIMSFPPGDAQLVGSVIKVHGTMHAHAVTDKEGNRQLEIDLDYLFVYPVEPPHDPASWMRVLDEVAWTVTFGDWQGAATPFEPSVGDTGNVGGVSGAICGTTDGYQHPDYPNNLPASAQASSSPSGTPVNPYEMGKPVTGSCEATTGT